MSTGGPRSNPEAVGRGNKYLAAKKGEKLDCLACTKGKIMGAKNVIRNCKACKGTGKIKV